MPDEPLEPELPLDPLEPLDDEDELPELLDDEDELLELDDELLDELLAQAQLPNRSGSQALSSANRLTTAHVPAGT